MIINQNEIKQIYLACGKTDLSKEIDGLAGVAQEKHDLDPYSQALYLFCGTRKNRFKTLYWDGDVSCCCTNDWKMIDYNCRPISKKFGS